MNFKKSKQTQVALGSFCRKYRMFHAEVPLREVAGDDQVKNLSGFEHGRSSNIELFVHYMRLADSRGEITMFFDGMKEAVLGEEESDDR